MSLHRLHIRGYRSLKDVTWEPGNLNILIGPNGGGKSNLLRMLQMIRAAGEEKLREFIIRDGGMEPILFANGARRRIAWDLTIRPSDNRHQTVRHDFEISRLGDTSDYQITRDDLWYQERGGQEEQAGAPSLRSGPRGGTKELKESLWVSISPVYRPSADEAPTARGFILGDELAFWAVHSDLHVSAGADMRRPTVSRHETRLDARAEHLVQYLDTLYNSSDEFRQRLDEGMKAAFPGEYERLVFRPAGGQGYREMVVKWRSINDPMPAFSLSNGTLYYLCLLSVLANPEPPPLIAIDEPELHLHPGMLPLVAECAMDAALKSQVIFATQSPDFLDCFTEEKVTTTVVTCESGETKLKNVGGERLERFLKEFRLGEMFRSGELENWREPGPPLPPGARERIAKLSQGDQEGG